MSLKGGYDAGLVVRLPLWKGVSVGIPTLRMSRRWRDRGIEELRWEE